MKGINIFIAGAKDLKLQRERLKVLATDMNNIFYKQGDEIRLNVTSYENFRNNQCEYNEYICNKADLIIFILDGKIGSYTKEEYLLSIENKRKTGYPQIVVFLKSYKEVTSEIAYINGLLTNEDYYINYDDENDLCHKVETYIRDYIQTYKRKKSGIIDLIRKYTLNFKLWMTLICIVPILLLAIIFNSNNDNPVLLIAGGGSARNYIELYKGITLEQYPSSYYVHMPSSNAWLLLTEEVISPQKNPKYYPLCISASTATEDDFLSIVSKGHFLEEGSVIEYKLGQDTLSVCIKNDPNIIQALNVNSFTNREISSKELVKLISEHDALNVFSTSPGSGTRNSYERLFNKENIDLDAFCFNQFSEFSDLPSINKNNLPYILLGSRCYVMNDLKGVVATNGAYYLNVFEEVNGVKEYICKPINLYFMAYKRNNGNDLYIPQQTIDFLNSMNCKLGNKIQNNLIKRYTTESIILQYELLPEW